MRRSRSGQVKTLKLVQDGPFEGQVQTRERLFAAVCGAGMRIIGPASLATRWAMGSTSEILISRILCCPQFQNQA